MKLNTKPYHKAFNIKKSFLLRILKKAPRITFFPRKAKAFKNVLHLHTETMIGSPFHISCPEIFHDDEKVFKYMHDMLSCFIYYFVNIK